MRCGIVDIPDARKVHRRPIPRVGGIAIFAGLAAGVSVMFWTTAPTLAGHFQANGARNIALMLAVTFVFLIGLADDVANLPAKLKLAGLLAASLFVCYFGVRIDALSFGEHASSLELGGFAWPVTILWLCGVPIALNFIDGLDGLAAGIATVTAVAASCIAGGHHGQPLTLALAVAIGREPERVHAVQPQPRPYLHGRLRQHAGGLCTGGVRGPRAVAAPQAGDPAPRGGDGRPPLRHGVYAGAAAGAATRHRSSPPSAATFTTACWTGASRTGERCCCCAGSRWPPPRPASPPFGGHWTLLPCLAIGTIVVVGFFHAAGAARFHETLSALRSNRRRSSEHRSHQTAFDQLQLRFAAATTFEQWWEVTCAAASDLNLATLELP